MIATQKAHVPTSRIFRDLLGDAGADQITLAWLLGNLGDRSFGILLLLLGLIGLVPGASTVTAILLLIPAVQMILARPHPILPRLIGSRRLSAGAVARLLRHAVPVLAWLERFAHPRWQTPFETTKRAVGATVMLLAVTLLSPLPFAHVLPNLAIMMIAFSFLEKDGVLLAISLLIAILSLGITAASVWATIVVPRYL